MDFNQFLLWLVSGGGALIAASWILGQIPGYVALVEKVKQWIFFALASVFAVGGFLGSQYIPASTLEAISPYFLIIAGIFSVVFLNKAYSRIVRLEESLKTLRTKSGK